MSSMTRQSISERVQLPGGLHWPATLAGILFLPVCTLFLGPLLSLPLLLFGLGPFLTGFLPGIITGSAAQDDPVNVTIVLGLISYVLCLAVLVIIYPLVLEEAPLSILFGVGLSILGSLAICRLFDWDSTKDETKPTPTQRNSP